MRLLVDYILQKKKKISDLENRGKQPIQNEAHRKILLK